MNSYLISTKKAIFILFFIAFTVRLSILLFFYNNTIAPDSISYHALAVNIAKGNGMSIEKQEPYEKWYFREPGYAYFLAGIYAIVNIFHGIDFIDRNTYDNESGKLNKVYPEIIVAKIVQITLDSLSIVILFLFLLKISDFKIAFLTAILTTLYFNLAFHSVYILRESLTMFILILLNGLFIKFLFTGGNKFFYLITIGLTIGILILIFQVNVVLLPVFFVLILFYYASFKKAISQSIIVILFSGLMILPHLITVYRFYPDMRIFKTFGCSFTHELRAYTDAVFRAAYYGVIPDHTMHEWGRNSKEQFDKSFNGYYRTKADSLNVLTPERIISERKIENLFQRIHKSIFLTKIGQKSGSGLINKYGYIIAIPLVLIPALIGVLGLSGLIVYWKKYLIFFLPFITYLLLFYILGSEYRRMIILQPYLIFFGLLFINRTMQKFWLKLV